MNCNMGDVLFLIAFGTPLPGETEHLEFPCH